MWPEQQRQSQVTIVCMGGTGTGKTTFVNLVAGSNFRVANDLESCTDRVQSHQFTFEGCDITLVDMPGFDDTSKSDSDLLRMIADFLLTEYQRGKKVNGILYFHRISDPRVGGTSKRNFTMFKKLCGEDVFENVAIVTTRWDEATEAVGNKRLAELRTKPQLFKTVIDGGAEIFRHDRTQESGGIIIRWLINKTPRFLLIQSELAGGKSVLETTAGQELQKEIMEQAKKHEKEIVALQEEKEKVQDETELQELEEECRALRDKMAHLQAESEKLAGTTERNVIGKITPTASDSSLSSRPIKVPRDVQTQKGTDAEDKVSELMAKIVEIERTNRRDLERLQVESKLEKERHGKWREDKERELKAANDRLEQERTRRKVIQERMIRMPGNSLNNRKSTHRHQRDKIPSGTRAITKDSQFKRREGTWDHLLLLLLVILVPVAAVYVSLDLISADG